jgi:hypothetical protein
MTMPTFRVLCYLPSLCAFDVIASDKTQARSLAEEKLADDDFTFNFEWQPNGDPIQIVNIHRINGPSMIKQ